MKTVMVKPKEVERRWYIIDAADQVLGRVAARVASILRGKHKPYFSPHLEIGDYVVVINAAKVKVTGLKATEKVYYRHSGYPSGLKSETFAEILARRPVFPLEHAIKGMLPKNRLGRKLFTNVKVYAGDTHPHAAQTPEPLEV